MRNQKTRWPQETVYLLDGEEQGNKQKLKELGKRVVGVSPSLVPLAPDNDRCQLWHRIGSAPLAVDGQWRRAPGCRQVAVPRSKRGKVPEAPFGTWDSLLMFFQGFSFLSYNKHREIQLIPPQPTAVLKMAFFPVLISSPFLKTLPWVLSIYNKPFLKYLCPIYL